MVSRACARPGGASALRGAFRLRPPPFPPARRSASTASITPSVRERRLGALAVTSAAVLWGLWPLWVRGGVSGAQASTLALLVAGVAGLPIALVLRARRGQLPGRRVAALLVLLALASGANTLFYFRALDEGAIAPAVLAHYLAPVLVALVAPRLLGEPRSRRTPLALALALAGTAILLLGGRTASGPSAEAVQTGALLGAASAVFYAAAVILSKRLAPSLADVELFAYHALLAAGALAAVTGVPPPSRDWLLPAIGGLVSALFAGSLYYAGLRRIPAERAGVLAYVEPLVTVLVGWLAFGEALGVAAGLGGALVLAGGLVVVATRE